jgi:putative iron-only hydrogenase system regulator
LGAAIFLCEVLDLETRVAVMSIIVENPDSVERLNGILHEYGEHIIGRMGLPYRKRKISIISVAMDAPQNTISSMAGKIGSLPGVSVKTAYSSVVSQE